MSWPLIPFLTEFGPFRKVTSVRFSRVIEFIKLSALKQYVAAAKAIQDYQTNLSAIAVGTRSRTQSYQLAQQVFSEDSAADKSPVKGANESLARLKLSVIGGKVDDTFWQLASGPFTFLWQLTRIETACSLQAQWEEKVLQKAQGSMDPLVMKALLEQEGPVWKFMKGPAAPFVGWGQNRGYFSKEALGGTIPLEPMMFSFLSKGARVKTPVPVKPNFNMTIRGLPTDANPEAKFKPHLTRLEFQCSAGTQVLENLNYPVSKAFNWSPEACGDVSLQIEVGNIALVRRYSGPQAFPTFVKEFHGGRRTYYPHDFPGERKALENQGIKYIRVNYQFSGQGAISGHVSSVPANLPRKISRCWN